ncbi:hypothetical protein ACVPPR_07275 [Dellaglioa sp. L3N]
MYLTYAEYTELGYKNVNENEYDQFEMIAEDTLDFETSAFYKRNDLEKDSFTFRRNQFKRAMAIQINYMNESGFTSVEMLNSTLSSMSIGRTSLSKGGSSSNGSDGSKTSLITSDAKNVLYHTGLLYKGVGYV